MGLLRAMPNVADPRVQSLRDMMAAIETGCPVTFSQEHVVNFNSLQIRYAERYVFSPNDDFGLARQMIAAHPELRIGPRPTTS